LCERKRKRERVRLGTASLSSKGIAWRTRRHGKARLRKRRALTKAAAPARSCIPAWHEGRHHQQQRGGAVRSTPARWPGNHKRGEAGVLTSVATGRSAGIGVVGRCGLPARRKKRKAAARRRGSRGSRGSSRSRRVRLLPRAALVFAAVGAPTGGSDFSLYPSSLHLLLRRFGGRKGSGFPPEAARVGSSRGGSATA
jgi:hypothetical protein